MWQATCLVCIKRAQSNLGGLWPSSCTHSPVSCGPGHHQPSWVSPKPQLKVLHSLSAQTSSWGREVAEGHPRQGTSSWRFELTQRHLRRKAHKHDILYISCWCSVSKMCLTLCNPMDCSTPGFPVLPHLSEFTQTLVHWVGDAIKPSHPLSPPSPPAQSLCQHQSFPMSQLFASGGQSIGASASVLPMNMQDWSPLGLTGLISLLSKGLLRIFSNTTVQKHQFFPAQISLGSEARICTSLVEKP